MPVTPTPIPRYHSVRGRLFLLIAALVLPALIIISVLSWEAFRTQRTGVRSELANTARAVAGLVDTEIDRSLATLQTFAASDAFQRRDWEEVDRMARRILPDTKRWFVIVGMDGRPIVNTRLPRGTPIPEINLAPEYVAAMREGHVFVSDFVFGPAANRHVVHVGMPFTATNGELIGLNLAMEPETLREVLDVRRFAPDGVLSIADRGGRIIVRSPYQKEFIGATVRPDMLKAMREAAEGVGESVTLEGIPVLTAFSHAKCGWGVAIGAPKAKVFAATRRLLFIGLGSAALVAFGGVGMAMWIARAVLRNVDGLARDAESLARGDVRASGPHNLQEIEIVAQAMRRLSDTRSQAEAELRNARDRLHQYAQELEKRVEERTASLREAVAQMEEFSYTISHDLRAPLRAMSGYAHALLEDFGPQLDEDGRAHLQRIIRSSDRMNRLTTDLLNYSRVATADVQRSRVNLETLVRGTIEHYGELDPSKADITVVSPLAPVWAHETSLTQALANLLTNAAKFVKPGERPKIIVRAEPRGNRVRVWVEDHGIGIPLAQQARLFRIFERSFAARDYEGTGVGLAIVRKVIEKMGGTCGVESDGQSGSRFWIELEAAPPEPESNATPPASQS